MLRNIVFLLGCTGIVSLCLRDILREQRAPVLAAPPELPDGPLVSVLIPARNEVQRLPACMEGLAVQQVRSFEVVVVDDHSSDGTAACAQNYAPRLPALQVVAGAALPEGWAGKCWACWQAAEHARGEWLLFLDADVEPTAGLLAALLAEAERTQADAITLMPRQRLGSLAERLLVPAFQTILLAVYPLDVVSDPRRSLAFFNGQAIFIRRAVYAATDGHRSVRGSVLEDTDYGALVKAAGYRIRAMNAFSLLQARMYTDWPSVAEGLGKNAVAGYRSGGWRSGWAGGRQSALAFGWLYLLGIGARWFGVRGALAGLGIGAASAATSGYLFRRRYGLNPLWGLAYPLGLALYFGLALRGLVRVRSGRGVVWKGRVLAGH